MTENFLKNNRKWQKILQKWWKSAKISAFSQAHRLIGCQPFNFCCSLGVQTWWSWWCSNGVGKWLDWWCSGLSAHSEGLLMVTLVSLWSSSSWFWLAWWSWFCWGWWPSLFSPFASSSSSVRSVSCDDVDDKAAAPCICFDTMSMTDDVGYLCHGFNTELALLIKNWCWYSFVTCECGDWDQEYIHRMLNVVNQWWLQWWWRRKHSTKAKHLLAQSGRCLNIEFHSYSRPCPSRFSTPLYNDELDSLWSWV